MHRGVRGVLTSWITERYRLARDNVPRMIDWPYTQLITLFCRFGWRYRGYLAFLSRRLSLLPPRCSAMFRMRHYICCWLRYIRIGTMVHRYELSIAVTTELSKEDITCNLFANFLHITNTASGIYIVFNRRIPVPIVKKKTIFFKSF